MPLLTTFLKGGTTLTTHCLWLHAIEGSAGRSELLGWLETPTNATHMQGCLPESAAAEAVTEVTFHHVSERDPKCHPLANVPWWSTYQTPFTIRQVVLPARLEVLAPLLDGQAIRIVDAPRSFAELRTAARGNACVMDPRWVADLALTLADLERLAAGAWLLVDLETMARLTAAAGAADAQLVTHAALHGLMSARVEYADVPTRGLALQDVVPYSTLDPQGRFQVRGIKANRAWQRYADDVGLATLLSGETPWAQRHGDVLSAMRAVSGGELIATDLPWLVAGVHGPVLAPHLAAHLLRMHLAAPIKEHLQYWTRWDDPDTIVRDIIDLARRYPPLRAVRWASPDPAVAHLGITLAPPGEPLTRHVLFATGRMDSFDVHDGLPPEPMMIFMKWLAREARERTSWVRQHLAGQAVTWQFDTAAGLKYAANYAAASRPSDPSIPQPEVMQVRIDTAAAHDRSPARAPRIALTDDEGLHGDQSLVFQDTLTRRLCRVIEGRARPDSPPGQGAVGGGSAAQFASDAG